MRYRHFGNTDLEVSEIGFGAWGIGGPAMAGEIPIGWGEVDDEVSKQALLKAYELGVNFFDTADFYGLGHSEELIGSTISDKTDAIIATKVGHRLDNKGNIFLDYSKEHILRACDESLRRLRRDYIDFYQLHSARMEHLNQGECIEAMEKLQADGKIRYWGISLNTFDPMPEAEFFIENEIGNGFQLVLSILNQRSLPLLQRASEKGYGIIARMALHFGLLTGKFDEESQFPENDHRKFRLPKEILIELKPHLKEIWKRLDNYNISKTSFALSFPLSYPEVSTVIPGIKTPRQAEENTKDIVRLNSEDLMFLEDYYIHHLDEIVNKMK